MDISDIAHKARNHASDVARTVTSPLRMLPSLLVIGGQKCGTTSLYRYLIQHSDVAAPAKKEPGFFDRRWSKGLTWYRTNFPLRLAHPDAITLDASTGYLSYPHAPQRVAEALPDVRLVALVRNPIDRAWSHYHHTVRLGHEDLPFDEAIHIEEERLGTYYDRVDEEPYYDPRRNYYSYLSRGHYAEQLEMWLACFDPSQLLVLPTDDLADDPKGTIARVLEHVGHSFSPGITVARHNSGDYDRRMDPKTRQWLREYFEPHNERLYELLSRDLGWQ